MRTRESSLVAVTAALLLAAGCGHYATRESDIEFVFEDSYVAGEKIEVRVKNLSGRTYIFDSYFQACELQYFDASGRVFKVPPGTHCDIRAEDEIRPGQTVTLFEWRLDECTYDDWGCRASESLPPGEYTISGDFMAKGSESTTFARGTFTIR
jgi:hypothetical protein